MEYKVISDKKVCGKRKGDMITSRDIVNAGGNEKQLLRNDLIEEVKNAPKATPVTPAPKATPAPKEEPQVIQQEEAFPVFNLVNNEQGDK